MTVEQYANEIFYMLQFNTELELCEKFWVDLQNERGTDFYLLVLQRFCKLIQEGAIQH